MSALGSLSERDLMQMSNEDLTRLAQEILSELEQDRRENALEHYELANLDAEPAHLSTAREVGIVGGHRAAKSDVMLAELAIQMTGVVPASLRARYPRSKLRPPIRSRLFCTSFQNSFEPAIKRKLMWTEWDGPGAPESGRGHWGWIPRRFLRRARWEESWSEKNRTLTLSNGSTCQVLSYEQDVDDVKVGSFHLICEDELGPERFHRQNRTRVMDVRGQIYTAATPPDDRSAAVTAAWFHDQIFVPGLRGDDPAVFSLILRTERNRLLSGEDIAWLARGLTEEQRAAQLEGKFLHLSGLVFPEFAAAPRTWCFGCEAERVPVDGTCPACAGSDLAEYAHVVEDHALPTSWPVVFYGDPHPRRPLAGIWARVDPNDDVWIEHECEIEPTGGPSAVRAAIEAAEEELGYAGRVVWRKLDAKMTRQGNEYAGEAWTIGKALRDVGLEFEDANVSKETGYPRLRELMRVQAWTRAPRLRVMRRCRRLVYQITHFVWDEHARRVDRDVKEVEKDAHSDFPAVLRFLANDELTWDALGPRRAGPLVYVSGRPTNRVTGY